MINKFQPVSFVCFTILFVIAGFIGGCKSPAKLVDEADRDAYAIIKEKWDPNFGEMSNYKIYSQILPLIFFKVLKCSLAKSPILLSFCFSNNL